MDYVIREVSILDSHAWHGVSRVLNDAFGQSTLSDTVLVDIVHRNTTTNSLNPSLYLAAMIGDEVIGFNAFISHELIRNGKKLSCYQVCWTATSSQHRGMKVFQNQLLAAHQILRNRGAAFVFAFPNKESLPLFTKKIGYHEIPSLKWQMLNLPGLRRLWYEPNPISIVRLKEDAIQQNDQQLIELKRQELGDRLVVVDFEGSVGWGVRRVGFRKGFSVPYLDIGGIDLASSEHLPIVMDHLRERAGFVAYCQIVTTGGNSFNQLLRRVEPSNSEPLIAYNLEGDTTDGVRFNFFTGVRDVFH